LFYNVLYNEIKSVNSGEILRFNEDGKFDLQEIKGDSNNNLSYHLFLKQILEQAIDNNNIQKYHFTLLRNLYEKTAVFLGYPQWTLLLPEDRSLYLKRIIQFSSHSTLSSEEVAEPNEKEKLTVKFLFENLINNYNFYQNVEEND